MANPEALRALRTALAGLYPASEDAVRVAGDAGLNIAYVSLSNKAINSWRNILAEAEKQDLVEAVVRVAREEYARSSLLDQAYADYVTAVRVSSVEAKPAVMEPDVDLAIVANLLQAAYTVDDLRRFCLYRPQFREVLDGVAARASLNDLVDAVILFSQTRGLQGDLLAEVERERPRQYARFASQLVAGTGIHLLT